MWAFYFQKTDRRWLVLAIAATRFICYFRGTKNLWIIQKASPASAWSMAASSMKTRWLARRVR
jgi:hypothetical protein